MTYATKERLAAGAIVALIAAELLFLGVHPAHAAVADWQRGAAMVPRWQTDFGSDSFNQSLTNLHNTGATAVALVVPLYQTNTGSTDIYAGGNTPTDASLTAAIDQAHALGLSVAIKVHIESSDGSWRAYINPSNRDAWFASYQSKLLAVATLAEAHHAELLVVGTELVSMAASSQNPTNTAHWQSLIAAVRGVYSGKLTYIANSNDNSENPFVNEKKYIGFWSSLDYAGISAYYTLNSDNSVAGLKGAWDYWNNNDIRAFAQLVGKPVLFGEVGYRSVDGAHQAPWDWGRGGGQNQDEQANSYEALLSYWNDYPYIAGVYWWDWSTDPNAGGGGDTSYVAQNKKAQTVMTNWFGSPTPPGTPPTPAPAAAFSAGASALSGATAGTPTSVPVHVSNTGGATNAVVDVEIYNSSGVRVAQSYFENQAFAAGATKSYSVPWTPGVAGSYKVAVGVFAGGWSSLYVWEDSAAAVQVGGSAPNSPPPPPNNPPPSNPPPANPPPSNPPPAGQGLIDNPQRTVRPGQGLDFVGRNFGHEEEVTIQLDGSAIRNAHADGGGNFSTGSMNAPQAIGAHTYTFTGQTSGISASATVTVAQ